MDTYELTIVGSNMIATASLIISMLNKKRKRAYWLVLTTLFTSFGAAVSVYRNQTLITPIPVPYVLILYLAKEAVTGLVLAAALTLYIWLYCDDQKKWEGIQHIMFGFVYTSIALLLINCLLVFYYYVLAPQN